MAYNHRFNYKGGTKRVRDNKRNKNIAKIIGWCVLWLFLGMLVAHIIFSVVENVSRRSDELEQQGIAPIVSIQDSVNNGDVKAVFYDGDLSDSFATDRFVAMMKKKGLNRVIIDVKPESGYVVYNTDVSLAKRMGALGETPLNLEEIVIKFRNADIKVTARMSLYADNVYALNYPKEAARRIEKTVYTDDETGEETVETAVSEEVWTDNESNSWISPYDKNNIEYAVSMIFDLSRYDIDSVMLDNVRFPTVFEGNDGNIGFIDEEESETPRAGIIQENLETIHNAAGEAGLTMYTVIDAFYTAGEQDEIAGITFNVFDFSTDILCPVCIPSRISADKVTSFGSFAFEDAETTPIPDLFDAMLGQIKIMQGALDNPPAMCPLVQAYTDRDMPGSVRRNWTAEDIDTEIKALEDKSVKSRIYTGTFDEYTALLPEPAADVQ